MWKELGETEEEDEVACFGAGGMAGDVCSHPARGSLDVLLSFIVCRVTVSKEHRCEELCTLQRDKHP